LTIAIKISIVHYRQKILDDTRKCRAVKPGGIAPERRLEVTD
jgi:hypothetical protein